MVRDKMVSLYLTQILIQGLTWILLDKHNLRTVQQVKVGQLVNYQLEGLNL
jgi:hypothetical protein